MKTAYSLLFIASFLPALVVAQDSSAIPIDQETHHHLVLKNKTVEVFEVELEPRSAISMHRHDTDEISIQVGEATTVSTTPGQADILTMSKVGDVTFTPRMWMHSVRNIGQTAYHSISVELLHPQGNARNLCGTQVKDQPTNCPATDVANASRTDQSQFETDQVRVTLTRIRPHQQTSFGESGRDDLLVVIDEVAMADKKLPPGTTLWISRGRARRILMNNSDKEARIATVACKP